MNRSRPPVNLLRSEPDSPAELSPATSERKRKRSSPAQNALSRDGVRSGTRGSRPGTDDEEDNGQHQERPTLTSCEACRKGKRRCEPSPLVPPDHLDAAKLPCARCRRFALECVRVKVTRRKGPAPVDLSAISDATHGFPPVPPRSGSSTSAHQLAAASSSSIPHDADLPNLDHVVARPLVDNIIGVFFDYVYPLTPCLHRPTFLADLTADRDRKDPVFFALVLMVLASTLVQVPRNLVNLDKDEVESLAKRCMRVSRSKLEYIWEVPVPVSSSLIVVAYLEGIVHLLLGNNTAHVVSTATANQLALAMRLNEETSYEGLDPIESEMRRRIYWLLFQADKSTACLRARTICLRLEDATNLRLPTEVDDEHITSEGILAQPVGQTPLIAGFNTNTNLFRILNDALLLQRRQTPPTVESIMADLRDLNILQEKALQTVVGVATPLRLRTVHDSRLASPAQDWDKQLYAGFVDFFNGVGNAGNALNSFLVMQGNILVTQHVVRIVLLQIRESLHRHLALLTQMPLDRVSTSGAQMTEAAEDIACELLDGLNSLPAECVATNGPSLVQKVRFVAIQLMESSLSPTPSTARAQKLLMQFLSVLGVIEGMYTFGRDISAE